MKAVFHGIKWDYSELAMYRFFGRRVETVGSNTKRFFVVVADDRVPGDIRAEKTTIAFATKHLSGDLVDALKIFQKHRLNLTRLESLPIPENPWEYVCYTDFEDGLHEPVAKRSPL